jgi:putative glutamine amidotransferase
MDGARARVGHRSDVTARPLIGVTGPSYGGGVAWLMTRLAIVRAGGRARRITPAHPMASEVLDGLVIGGGADLNPSLYREVSERLGEMLDRRSAGTCGAVERSRSGSWASALALVRSALMSDNDAPDAARDALERDVLARAIEAGLPILGICRGAQLLNVFFGGTLYPDVRQYFGEAEVRTVLPRRRVSADPASHLARVIGATSFKVNALHRQAVRAVGTGWAVVARDECGIVQAIEERDHRFRLGVQWHPEYIPQEPRQRALFADLVSAARARR